MLLHRRSLAGLLVFLAACSAPATSSRSTDSPKSAGSPGASGDPGAPPAVEQSLAAPSGSTLPTSFTRIRAAALDVPSVDRTETPMWAAGGIQQTMLMNCVGGDRLTRDPVYTFTLAEPIAKARFRSVGAETLFLGPDDLGLCGAEWEYALPAGEYRVYGKDSTIKDDDKVTEIVLTHIANEKALLAETVAALPVVELQSKVVNPTFGDLRTGRLFDTRDVGVSCVSGLVTPLANLDVEGTDRLYFGAKGQQWYVLVDAAGAYCVAGEETFEAGRYAVFVLEEGRDLDAPARELALEIDVRSRPLAFPKADRGVDLAARVPTTVQMFEGTVREPAPRQAKRAVSAGCAPAADAPDGVVTVGRETTAQLLWSGAELSLRVVGQDQYGNQQIWCGASVPQLREGSYAVWIAGAAGTAFQLALYDEKTAIDPFAMLVKPPAELAVADRQVDRFYPFFAQEYRAAVAGEDRPSHPFLVLPDSLLVYAVTDLEHMKQHEPGIVIEGGAKRSKVRNLDGKVVEVLNGELTTVRPAKVVVGLDQPEEPVIQWAINAPHPDDEKAVARYVKLYETYSDCYDAYIQKHDQSGEWTVLRVKRDGSIVNLNDAIADRANKTCGSTKVEKAQDKLLAELRKTQLARYKARLARLEARFVVMID